MSLINCVLPVTSIETPVAWIRGKRSPGRACIR